MKRWVILILVLAISLTTCVKKEVKLPAVEVVFVHYVINGRHIIRIEDVKATMIPASKAPTLYPWYNTPFPGIILYAYDWRNGKLVFVTPSTYVPLKRQGKIVAYIGFKSPKLVPKKGDKVLVLVGAYDRMGHTLAYDAKIFVWNLNWKPSKY